MTAGAHAHAGNHMFHWPRVYDFMLRLFWRSGESSYRRNIIGLASIGSGDTVIDVGCGTGTLAIAAASRAGASGKVLGIDPSPQMVARARAKAKRAGLAVNFLEGEADNLPFGDSSFDAVLSTTVLHCIPADRLSHSIREMVRVLKPEGRLLLVDFGGPSEGRSSFVSRMRPHCDFDICNLVAEVRKTAVADVRTGAFGFSDLHFIAATKQHGATEPTTAPSTPSPNKKKSR